MLEPEIIALLKEKNSRKLRALSDRLLAEGFIEKDKQTIKLSIIAHALAKITEKNYYLKDKKRWEEFVSTMGTLLESNDLDQAEKKIVELDRYFGRYHEDIIKQSRIRRGSTLYAWGVSLSLASELVGIPEYELLSHIGKTKMVDEEGRVTSALERLKHAEEVL